MCSNSDIWYLLVGVSRNVLNSELKKRVCGPTGFHSNGATRMKHMFRSVLFFPRLAVISMRQFCR
jgi:hypothetical protein